MFPLSLPLLIRHGLLITRLSGAKGPGAGQGDWPPHPSAAPHIEAISSSLYLEGSMGEQGSLGDILNYFSCWQKGRKGFQNET